MMASDSSGSSADVCFTVVAVQQVSVHGVCGILGVVFAGIFLDGYPPFSDGIPTITFMGQFKGAIVIVLELTCSSD